MRFLPKLIFIVIAALGVDTSDAARVSDKDKKLGHLKREVPTEATKKNCVYDVFGREQTIIQDRRLPCPRTMLLAPPK